jgi:hypothetical protein
MSLNGVPDEPSAGEQQMLDYFNDHGMPSQKDSICMASSEL